MIKVTDSEQPAPDATDGFEDGADLSPTQRRASVRARLAADQSVTPSVGETTVWADAMKDARTLADEYPHLVRELVLEICWTIEAAASAPRGKGNAVMLGAFRADVRREGLAVLANLSSRQLLGGDETQTRVQSVVETVTAVLSGRTDPETVSHAIDVLGTVAGAYPHEVAAGLNDRQTLSETSALVEKSEAVLEQVADRDLLVGLLRGMTVLATHDATRSAVAPLDSAVIAGFAERDATLVRAWCHALSQELGWESPIAPEQVWQELEAQAGKFSTADPSGQAWWLLAAYSDIEPLSTAECDPLDEILRRENAGEAVRDVIDLPEQIFEAFQHTERLFVGTLIDALERSLDFDDVDARLNGVNGLVAIIRSERVSSEARYRAIAMLEAFEPDDATVRMASATGLAAILNAQTPSRDVTLCAAEKLDAGFDTVDYVSPELVERLKVVMRSDEPSNEIKLLSIGALANGLESKLPLIRSKTAEKLAEIVHCAEFPTEVRQRALEALDTSLAADYTPEQVTAARELASVQAPMMSSEVRRRAATTLKHALDADSRYGHPDAADGLAEIAETVAVSTEVRQEAAAALEAALHADHERTRYRAAAGLATVVENEIPSSDLRQQAAEALATALRDPEGRWPLAVIRVLIASNEAERLSNQAWQQAVEAVEAALEINEFEVQREAMRSLLDIATSVEAPATLRRRAANSLEDDLDTVMPTVRVETAWLVVDSLQATFSADLRNKALSIIVASFDDEEKLVRQYAVEDAITAIRRGELDDSETKLVLEGLQARLLDDSSVIREKAASAVRAACEIYPGVVGSSSALLVTIQEQLASRELAVTRELLIGLQSLAETNPQHVEPILPDTQGLLAGEEHTERDILALELLSILERS